MNCQRFKGVWIPKEIMLDKNLTALEKIIFGEINTLGGSPQGCYATNKYLASCCGCSETKISNAISKLISLGYLKPKRSKNNERVLITPLQIL